jgi:hypothetical protein
MWGNPDIIINVLGFSLLVSYALVIWFKTNAFVEYLTLFKLSRFFYISNYNELVQNGYSGTYTEFLREYYHDYFVVRLTTCPVCFGFWLGLPFLLLSPAYLLVLPLGLFFYGLFNKLV